MTRVFIVLVGSLGLLNVVAGVYGAHGMNEIAKAEHLPNWQIAVEYHMSYTLALLGMAWLCDRFGGPLFATGGILFVVGVVLFSGTLYLQTIWAIRGHPLSDKLVGTLAPTGGTCLMLGWLCVALGAFGIGLKKNPGSDTDMRGADLA